MSATLAMNRRRTGRRRLYLLIALIAALAVVGIMLLPTAKKAIQSLTLPLNYASIIRQQAQAKHLNPALVAAVIYAETRFRPHAVSSAGAEGLMQVEPTTAEFLARRSGATTFTVSDLSKPQVNIAYGSYLLRYLLNKYDGDKGLALAAYNAGETNVDNWIANARSAGRTFTIADIPISQTRAYVHEVLTKEREYRSHYASELGYS